MPTTWVFEPILRAFILTSQGTAPLPEFFAVLEEVLAHPKAGHRLRILIDNRMIPAPTSEIVREGLSRLAGYADRLENATIMFVVPGTHDHGIGRLATQMLEGRIEVEVFNDMAAAVTSLAMDEQD
ncbi:MAG: hypothetical protein ABIZ71_00515 [Gemmatimonadales bacterium]